MNKTDESMSSFKFAWIRIVADAWSDEETWNRLLSAKPSEVRQIFVQYGAEVPLDMEVKIVAPAEGDTWDARTRTWQLGGAKVELPLPPRPKDSAKDPGQIGVALATYEWLGQSYPFSCCC
jgi:ribosomally synthesized peptide (two-chain TOMM family)